MQAGKRQRKNWLNLALKNKTTDNNLYIAYAAFGRQTHHTRAVKAHTLTLKIKTQSKRNGGRATIERPESFCDG